MGKGNLAADNQLSMIGEAVIQLLFQDTVLSGLVAKRIRPNVVKTDDLKTGGAAISVLDYRMEKMGCDDSSNVYNGVLEIAVYSTDYKLAVKVIKNIRRVMDDYSGFITLVSGEGVVGLTISRGEGTPDDYDESGTTHIKVIEYEAYAQIQ